MQAGGLWSDCHLQEVVQQETGQDAGCAQYTAQSAGVRGAVGVACVRVCVKVQAAKFSAQSDGRRRRS
jgi:hypothetical protein